MASHFSARGLVILVATLATAAVATWHLCRTCQRHNVVIEPVSAFERSVDEIEKLERRVLHAKSTQGLLANWHDCRIAIERIGTTKLATHRIALAIYHYNKAAEVAMRPEAATDHLMLLIRILESASFARVPIWWEAALHKGRWRVLPNESVHIVPNIDPQNSWDAGVPFEIVDSLDKVVIGTTLCRFPPSAREVLYLKEGTISLQVIPVGDCYIVAAPRRLASSFKVAAVLKTGDSVWDTEILALGPRSGLVESSHRWSIQITGDCLSIFGFDKNGFYVEVLDVKDGRLLFRWNSLLSGTGS